MDAAGMQHILEDTEVRGTVLKFANLSSELLAYGGLDGIVRIAQLGNLCKICHVSIWLTGPYCKWITPVYEGCSCNKIAHSMQCQHQNSIWAVDTALHASCMDVLNSAVQLATFDQIELSFC